MTTTLPRTQPNTVQTADFINETAIEATLSATQSCDVRRVRDVLAKRAK